MCLACLFPKVAGELSSLFDGGLLMILVIYYCQFIRLFAIGDKALCGSCLVSHKSTQEAMKIS